VEVGELQELGEKGEENLGLLGNGNFTHAGENRPRRKAGAATTKTLER
jgi:hypothetical protein